MSSLLPEVHRMKPIRLRPAVAALSALAAAMLAAALPACALPPVQKVVSPGGIEAWLIELHDAPLVTFRIGFAGGTLQDPEGRYGAGDMAAYLFAEGAGPYDSAELRRRLTRIGAGLDAAVGFEQFTVSFATPTAHKAEAFELLRLALDVPRFDAEPLARARAGYLTDVEAARKSPGTVAALALRQNLLGAHPMAVPLADRRAGYQSIEAADIAAWRVRLLARDNVKVAVAGAIGAAELAPLLDRLLGGLPAKAALRPVSAPAGAAGSCRFTPMDVPQAVVKFAGLTPRLAWRQRLAWWVLESILDEGASTGRLSRALREERGLVYDIDIAYGHYAGFGLFEGGFDAKMAEVPEAFALTWAELRRMVEKGPTEAEAAAARRAVAGKVLLGLDTGAEIADLLLSLRVNDQPATYLDGIAGEIGKVTRQDVWEVAKLLLDPRRLDVTVVGAPGQADVCAAMTARAR
jgi:zinc protease